ncbi:MAG: hypothetical protein GKR98_00205 [Boseongicola sp.]|nr:MAG: hypothetical protein GKR98_00205 [Boseongicola sp.]
MSDNISVRFAYDRALTRRAMTGWWQSIVPPEPFLKRAIIWAGIWFGLLLVTFAITAYGLTPYFTVAGLAGAGVMVAAFSYLQRTRMSRFWDEVGSHWDRAGETQVDFNQMGVRIRDGVSERRLKWSAIDAIKTVKGGTVFRSAVSMLVVPDAALPGGMTAKDFRAQLTDWRTS